MGDTIRWQVSNFKGLKNASLDLSPGTLTVLSGVNSSGKSSILQSLLLTAQSQYHDGAIVLNGPLVRLGDSKDLVRHGSDGTIRIGLDWVPEARKPHNVSTIATVLDLIPTADDSSFRVHQLSLGSGLETDDFVLLNSIYSRSQDVDAIEGARETSLATDYLHVKGVMRGDSRSLRTYVGLQGMVPVEIVQVNNARDIDIRFKKMLTDFLSRFDKSDRMANDITSFRVVAEFVKLLDEALPDDNGHHVYADLLKARNGNPYTFALAWRGLDEQERAVAIGLAAQQRSLTPLIRIPIARSRLSRVRGAVDTTGLLENKLSGTLRESLGLLVQLAEQLVTHGNRVQYLGPLRDEPRVIWNQWNELARGLPVGTRGEYSAVVLSRSALRKVTYATPEREVTKGTLLEAVDRWLAYLEIGNGVLAKDLGKLGIGLQVQVNGVHRDLTSVGVGVSQALPIVVAVLSVPEKATFIVEQPELHLHPAVQSRLADFLSTARPDISLVVETHSEAFITRIRRRVAENVLDRHRVKVTFLEPSDSGSMTRELELTATGDLSDWPAGFFSDTTDDTAAIMQANIARLRREVSNAAI